MSDVLHPASSYAWWLLRHLRYLGSVEDTSEKCEICWEVYSKEDPAVQILGFPGCHHIFGRKCLGLWLHTHNTCPKCRGQLYAGWTPAKALASMQAMRQAYQDNQNVVSLRGDRYHSVGTIDAGPTIPTTAPSLNRLGQMLQVTEYRTSPHASISSTIEPANPQFIKPTPTLLSTAHPGSLHVPQDRRPPDGDLDHTSNPTNPQPTNRTPASSATHRNNVHVTQHRILPNDNQNPTSDPINPRLNNLVQPLAPPRPQYSLPQNMRSPNAIMDHDPNPYNPEAINRPPASPIPSWRSQTRRPQDTSPLRRFSNWRDSIDRINPRSTDTRDLYNLPCGCGKPSTARSQNRVHQADVRTPCNTRMTRHEGEERENEVRRLRQEDERQRRVEERRHEDFRQLERVAKRRAEISASGSGSGSGTAVGQAMVKSLALQTSSEDQMHWHRLAQQTLPQSTWRQNIEQARRGDSQVLDNVKRWVSQPFQGERPQRF